MKHFATTVFSTFLACLLALTLVTPAQGQTATFFTVNSAQDQPDSDPTDGECFTGETAPNTSGRHKECTLRAAIDEANATTGKVVINLPGTLAGGNSGKYTLNRISETNELYDDQNDFGDLDITRTVTDTLRIQGTGTPGPTVTISKQDRILEIVSGATVAIERVHFTGGTARKGDNGNPDGSGTQGVDGEDGPDGGALLISNASANVIVEQSTFNGNVTQAGGNGAVPSTSIARTEGGAAGDGGGAIFNGGTLTIEESTMADNAGGDPS